MAAHLPDPFAFWVVFGLTASAAMVTWTRSRDLVHLLFGGFVLTIALSIGEFALFLEGVHVPEAVSRLVGGLGVVLPVLLVLHHPRVRFSAPGSAWLFAGAGVIVLVLGLWRHLEAPFATVGLVRNAVLSLVVPLVAGVFVLDARAARSARVAFGLVLLAVALFVRSAPAALYAALSDYERLVGMDPGGPLWVLHLSTVLVGAVKAFLLLAVMSVCAAAAMRGGARAGALWFGAVASGVLVAFPLVLADTGSTVLLDYGAFVLPVLVAALGVVGLSFSSEGGDAGRGGLVVAGQADPRAEPLPDEDA